MPVTVDEATADPPPVETAASATVIGNSGEFSKTITDTSSVEAMLASLEWNAPPTDPKLPVAAPQPPAPLPVPAVPDALPAFEPAFEAAFEAAFSLPPEPMLQLPDPAPQTAPEPAPQTAPEPAPPAPEPVPAFVVPSEPPPRAPEPTPEPAPRGPSFGKTMIGGSVTAAEVMAEAERTKVGRPASEHRTMIGRPALDQPAFDPGPPPPVAQPSQPPADPQAYRPAFKTMIGVAIPGIAPVRDSERALASPSHGPVPVAPGSNPHFPVAPPHPSHRPPAAQHGSFVPSHPPSYPSHPAHAPVPPQSSRPFSAPGPVSQSRAPGPMSSIVPPPAPLVEEPLPQAPRAAAKGGISAIAVVMIVFVLVAIGGGVAGVVFLRAGAPLTARARLDESGKESLEIRCESCPDGTKIALGAASASVAGAGAILALPAPLSIGDNDLELVIDRPGAGRDEKVKVHVPIAYRVKADLTTLSANPPAVTVRVEATPGAEVTVDGKPLPLDATGKGAYALDVSAEVLGPSDDQKAIDRKIPFSVKRKAAATADPGELVVRAAIVPLHLDAPGSELTTDRTTANVAGQTKPGGALTIDGQTVAVDATGRFAIRAELPAEGEKTLTIVATAPPLAPRTIRAKVTRVASLDAAAQALDAASPLGFDAYSADPATKMDKVVVVNGEVLEIRVTQGYSVMVVEEKKDCAAGGGCVLRLVHGEEVRAVRGDTIRAYGKVAGTVAWNGKTVPAIVGTLAIAVSKGYKK